MKKPKENFFHKVQEIRNDYQAAKSTRFRRIRNGLPSLGGSADYHYRSETDFLKIMEYARDMDRNDVIVSQTVDRSVSNVIQDGIKLDFNTGDRALDSDLLARWEYETHNPQTIDSMGELNLTQMQRLVLRQMIVDGDIFALFDSRNCIQLIEAHRCRSLDKPENDVINGVKLDEWRRRIQYWFTKEDINPSQAVRTTTDIIKKDAYDKDGNKQVFQIYNPKRVSQTRGVSAFAPIFDLLGMLEDINFAKLVQQQIVSCFAIFRKRDLSFRGGENAVYGEQYAEALTDGSSRLTEGIAPGMEIVGLPGEELSGFSPNVPNPEFFEHFRLMLQLVGVNLGMPLILLLMDASETNFSGWRGAFDQAKMGFKDLQNIIIWRFLEPVFDWKVRVWAAEDPILFKRADLLRKHRWNSPRWPYIQPLDEARADELRQNALLISPRRLHAESGRDWDDISTEIVEDRSKLIEKAIEAAKKLSAAAGDEISWRELVYLSAENPIQGGINQNNEMQEPNTDNVPDSGKRGAKRNSDRSD